MHHWWQIRDVVNHAYLWYWFFGDSSSLLRAHKYQRHVRANMTCLYFGTILEVHPNKMRLWYEIHPRRVWIHPHLQWEVITSKTCLKYPRLWCLIAIGDCLNLFVSLMRVNVIRGATKEGASIIFLNPQTCFKRRNVVAIRLLWQNRPI
jgi:hypothetical protein